MSDELIKHIIDIKETLGGLTADTKSIDRALSKHIAEQKEVTEAQNKKIQSLMDTRRGIRYWLIGFASSGAIGGTVLGAKITSWLSSSPHP